MASSQPGRAKGILPRPDGGRARLRARLRPPGARRDDAGDDVEKTVRKIVERVRDGGDEELRRLRAQVRRRTGSKRSR